MSKIRRLEALATNLMVPPIFLDILLDARQRVPRTELQVKSYAAELTRLAFSQRNSSLYAQFREFVQRYASPLGKAAARLRELRNDEIDLVLDYVCLDKCPHKF